MKCINIIISLQVLLTRVLLVGGENLRTEGEHGGSFYDTVVSNKNTDRGLSVCQFDTCNAYGQKQKVTRGSACTDILKIETCNKAIEKAHYFADNVCHSSGECSCVGALTEEWCEVIADGNTCTYRGRYNISGTCQETNSNQCIANSCIGVGTSTLESPDECTDLALEETCVHADEQARLDSTEDCTQTSTCDCQNGSVTRQTCQKIDVSSSNNPNKKCIYVGVSLYTGTCS
uniref:Uncharacterized protein n=1 Tax=Eucampia antarctica TaxID=49252 RepID=A0A7S2SFT9_9STRA